MQLLHWVFHHHCIRLSQLWLKLIHMLRCNHLRLIIIILRQLCYLLLLRQIKVLIRRWWTCSVMILCSSICSITTVPLFFFHLMSVVTATNAKPRFELLLAHNPVIHEIKVEAFPHKELSHHWDKLLIVWFFLELEFSGVIQELTELLRIACSEILYASHGLLNFDLFIFLLLSFSREALPWETPSNEVH